MDRAQPIFSSVNPDIAQLKICRGQASAALTTYQLYKHREFFPLLKNSRYGAVVDGGHDIQANCISLGNDFRAHAAKWKDVDVTKHWQEYSRLASQLIERTRKQLARDAYEAQRMAWLAAAPADRIGAKSIKLAVAHR